VGNLGTVVLRVYYRTVVPIFIEIGTYLSEKEQNISWHSFFETRCITRLCLCVCCLSCSGITYINLVDTGRVTQSGDLTLVCGIRAWYLTKPFSQTQPGRPSWFRRNE